MIEKRQTNMSTRHQNIIKNKDIETISIIEKLHTSIENIVIQSETNTVNHDKDPGDLDKVNQDL